MSMDSEAVSKILEKLVDPWHKKFAKDVIDLYESFRSQESAAANRGVDAEKIKAHFVGVYQRLLRFGLPDSADYFAHTQFESLRPYLTQQDSVEVSEKEAVELIGEAVHFELCNDVARLSDVEEERVGRAASQALRAAGFTITREKGSGNGA